MNKDYINLWDSYKIKGNCFLKHKGKRINLKNIFVIVTKLYNMGSPCKVKVIRGKYTNKEFIVSKYDLRKV